jgi:hypothetical protein
VSSSSSSSSSSRSLSYTVEAHLNITVWNFDVFILKSTYILKVQVMIT